MIIVLADARPDRRILDLAELFFPWPDDVRQCDDQRPDKTADADRAAAVFVIAGAEHDCGRPGDAVSGIGEGTEILVVIAPAIVTRHLAASSFRNGRL